MRAGVGFSASVSPASAEPPRRCSSVVDGTHCTSRLSLRRTVDQGQRPCKRRPRLSTPWRRQDGGAAEADGSGTTDGAGLAGPGRSSIRVSMAARTTGSSSRTHRNPAHHPRSRCRAALRPRPPMRRQAAASAPPTGGTLRSRRGAPSTPGSCPCRTSAPRRGVARSRPPSAPATVARRGGPAVDEDRDVDGRVGRETTSAGIHDAAFAARGFLLIDRSVLEELAHHDGGVHEPAGIVPEVDDEVVDAGIEVRRGAASGNRRPRPR